MKKPYDLQPTKNPMIFFCKLRAVEKKLEDLLLLLNEVEPSRNNVAVLPGSCKSQAYNYYKLIYT